MISVVNRFTRSRFTVAGRRAMPVAERFLRCYNLNLRFSTIHKEFSDSRDELRVTNREVEVHSCKLVRHTLYRQFGPQNLTCSVSHPRPSSRVRNGTQFSGRLHILRVSGHERSSRSRPRTAAHAARPPSAASVSSTGLPPTDGVALLTRSRPPCMGFTASKLGDPLSPARFTRVNLALAPQAGPCHHAPTLPLPECLLKRTNSKVNLALAP